MVFYRSLGKIIPTLSHLPTLFLIVGYPLFWIELSTHQASHGVTSGLPWFLICLGMGYGFTKVKATKLFFKNVITPFFVHVRTEKVFWFASFVAALIIIGISAVASLKPIHLIQEADCMQYHYTLPRQHLVLGSFAFIPWAADDLFLLPIDFSLAPFWFTTVLPNKIPQLVFFFGLLGMAMRLTSLLAGQERPWAGPLATAVIIGTHGLGIQMGTGMLDMVIVYLFLAGLDSLRLGNWFLAGVEFTFFFWSKPLMPLEVIVILGVLWILFKAAQKRNWQIVDTFEFRGKKKALGVFIALSILVAGPFLYKSFYYAGTPLFPLAPEVMGEADLSKTYPETWVSLQKASQIWMSSTKDGYGHGRDLMAWVWHWWLLAVPEHGVNNSFDYPLGLTYLLFIGPFIFSTFNKIVHRKFSPLSILVLIIWILWWFSSQQSRFLYLPLTIIFILTIARLERIPASLWAGILISLIFQMISLWGAHKSDLGRWGRDVLRVEDQRLVELNQKHEKTGDSFIDWPTHDVAYAQFPVMVHKEFLPHTIKF